MKTGPLRHHVGWRVQWRRGRPIIKTSKRRWLDSVMDDIRIKGTVGGGECTNELHRDDACHQTSITHKSGLK